MEMITALGGIGAAFGLSSSAGLNAYIPLLVVALASRFPLGDPLLQLAEPYNMLGDWLIIGVLLFFLFIEMTVDKIPAVDTFNDIIQTVIRPTAGAVLFAANAEIITDISPALALISGLVLAGGVHVTKGAVRPAVTASTAGTGNWLVSLLEDIIATVVSILSLLIPILMSLLLLMVAFYVGARIVRRRRQRRPFARRPG